MCGEYLQSVLCLDSFRAKPVRLAQPGTDALRVKGDGLGRVRVWSGGFPKPGIQRPASICQGKQTIQDGQPF